MFVPLYFVGAGVNPSRLRPGSGFGLGFGAFLASFLPLSLLPMQVSLPQLGGHAEDFKLRCGPGNLASHMCEWGSYGVRMSASVG